jgi:dihydroflavonol-4-reductase
VIVSPTAPVGPGDRRPSATGRRIVAALAGELLPYPPGGINFIPVQDAAAGHLLAAVRGQPGRTYILGHREGNLSQTAFLRLVAEAAGRPIVASARRAADGSLPAAGAALPPGLTANPTRAIVELGLPQSDLRQAFAAAVAWFGG